MPHSQTTLYSLPTSTIKNIASYLPAYSKRSFILASKRLSELVNLNDGDSDNTAIAIAVGLTKKGALNITDFNRWLSNPSYRREFGPSFIKDIRHAYPISTLQNIIQLIHPHPPLSDVERLSLRADKVALREEIQIRNKQFRYFYAVRWGLLLATSLIIGIPLLASGISSGSNIKMGCGGTALGLGLLILCACLGQFKTESKLYGHLTAETSNRQDVLSVYSAQLGPVPEQAYYQTPLLEDPV